MKGFKDRYIKKGDDIAYAFSIHHDTKVPHAHLYILPYTKNGEYISMNASKYLRGKSKKQALKKEGQIVENKLEYLKTTSEKN